MKKRILSLILVLVMLFTFTACNRQNSNPIFTDQPQATIEVTLQPTPTEIILTDSQKFDKITDAMYRNVMEDNYYNCFSNLHDRSSFSYVPKDFGKISLESEQASLTFYEDCQKKLKDIDITKLTDTQKISYQVVNQDIAQALAEKDFFYFESPLNSITGLQSELPLCLSLVDLYNKDDVDNYLEMVSSLKSYYVQVIDFETKRAELGLLASDANLDKVITACDEIAKEKDNNFLISTFNDRIDQVTWLTSEEKSTYKAKNLDTIQNVVIPAYQYLSAELTKLKGKGVNTGGLCNFKDGKTYYELLLKEQSSTDLTVAQAITLLDSTISTTKTSLQKSFKADSSLATKLSNLTLDLGSPQKNLDYVKNAIAKDYPPLPEHTVSITSVPAALEDSFSPAAYITPQLDDIKNNKILVNNKALKGDNDVLGTMAHEGYPGHLYQFVFTYSSDIDNYRKIANYTGFSEGWAMFSDDYICNNYGTDKNLMSAFVNYKALTNSYIPARIDIGVNYEGWTLEKTKSYLASVLGKYDDYAKSCYDMAVEVPCYYVKYSLGYIELTDLVNEAKTKLGSKFVYKDCMAEIMRVGNAPVNIVEQQVRAWEDNVVNGI